MSGGVGKAGVSGTGKGFGGGWLRLRGSSLGSRFRRSGIVVFEAGRDDGDDSVIEGIFETCMLLDGRRVEWRVRMVM